jgi:hypothetical protein
MRSDAVSLLRSPAAVDMFIVSPSLQHERRSRAVKYRQAPVKFCKTCQGALTEAVR